MLISSMEPEVCRALLKILWDESVTGLAIVKEDGSFFHANTAFCRIVEYTESELKRLKYQDITVPSDLRADVEMAALTASGEYPGYRMTKSYITKTQKVQPVLLQVTALRVNGQFIYFVAEIAPLEPEHEPAGSVIATHAKRRIFFKTLRENWHIIAALVAGAGWVIAEVYSRVSGGGY